MYLSLLAYFFFKLSSQGRKQPKLSAQSDSFFYKQTALLVVFLFLSLSYQPALGAEHLTSSSLDAALVHAPLIIVFSGFILLFLELLKSSHFKAQLSSLLLFIFLVFFLFFFCFFFTLTNHFELMCIFEYTNALLVLYILITTPSLKPSVDLFKSSLGKNTKFLTSYFFLPALLNYFFLLFIISIFLFYFYIYLIVDLSFAVGFTATSISNKSSIFTTFFLTFLIFKLGIAPLHFWKLEIFESFRLAHFSFFSTIYFLFSLVFFDFISSRMSLLAGSGPFLLLCAFILYNLFFCFFHINTALNIRQFLVLSALLNLNLALLSLLLSLECTQPFFLFFVTSYVVLAFTFYFYFIISNSGARYFSNLAGSWNNTFYYFFFLLPLLSLSGGAPSLAFFYKLNFLLTNLQEDRLILISLYILSIIVSVVFYFQLFKVNGGTHEVTAKHNAPLNPPRRYLLIFFFIVLITALSTPLLGPLSFYLLDSFIRVTGSLLIGL